MAHENQTSEYAKIILKYTGDNIGISQVKFISELVRFCKGIDNRFQCPMPPKEISTVWQLDDWCDWVDSHWNKYSESVRNGKM